MAAQFERSAGTRVALIGRDDPVRAQLHSALAEAGAQVVFESDLRGLSLAALRGSSAEVVIINLEPGSEDGLDAIDDLLVDGSIEVVFNESDVTSKLVGWDLARWARHLAAKVAGHGDATPPAPPGAEPLPQRDLRLTQVVAPPSPVRPTEELQMQPFAEEARSVEVDVPVSQGPDPRMQAAAEEPPAAVALSGFQIERPGEQTVDAPFEIDLGEIESSLGAIGDGGALPMPRRAASDAPTVVLSRDELQQHLSIDPDSLQGLEIPRRLGADEPTTVLDLAEVEASLAAIGQGVTTLVPEPEFTVAMAEPDPGLDRVSTGSEPDFSLDFGSAPTAGPDTAGELDLALDLGRELSAVNADAGVGLDIDLPDFDPASGGFRSLAAAEGESLDLGMDADVAALAAQFDSLGAESAVGEATDDLARGFDFSLDLDLPVSAPAQSTPAASAQPRSESGPAPAPARQSSFGELSLAGLGDEVPAAAPVERSAASSFDFSSINLSLEPTEDEQAAPTAMPAPAAAEGSIRRVIVLGASIGGPDALRSFLAGIPQDFPALFVLVQHLENGFFNRLAQQLQKSTPLKLRVADDGAGEAHMGEVLVVPSTARFGVDRNGGISRQDYAEPPRYKPCIDDMLRAAADAFGRDALAIIFSGMAGDAIEGASYVTAKGGEVWAQDPSSCVVSSMVDGAMARGVVEFTGSPRELAERCIARFGAG